MVPELRMSGCLSTEMNRHHYSLYVHNCRLVFLLRRDFTQVDTFRPAEYHWKLEQVGGGVAEVWGRVDGLPDQHTSVCPEREAATLSERSLVRVIPSPTYTL